MKSKIKKTAPTKIKSGAELRQYRQSLGLTQVQLAERLAVTAEYLSMLEKGKRTGMRGINMRLRIIQLESN